MMRKKLKTIIGCIVTLCLTVCLLGYLTNLTERKSSDYKYADFFEQSEDFNVLFMGTSHVINAVFPMELWDDYGIVSYNFGGHGSRVPTTYWTMENALDYTTPNLVVIDCYSVSALWKCSEIFSYLHLSFDAFPLSKTKIKAIWDLLDDPYLEKAVENGTARESDEPRTKIGLLWNYSVFHSRWTELSQNDFGPDRNLEKGAESRINVCRNSLNKIDASQKMEPGTVGEEYLRMMIEDCQSRGIDVLLTYLPFPAADGYQKEANYIYDLAAEYGVNYINFLDLDIIDYQTDLYDEASHLNPSGARKVTDYLGAYITENYAIVDQRNNPAYDFWNLDYDEYIEVKNNNLRAQPGIVNYLMLLSNEKTDIVLDVRNKDLYKNTQIMELLKNMGVDINAVNENTDFIIKLNGFDTAVIIDDFRDDSSVVQTDIGKIELFYDSTGEHQDSTMGYYGLYIDDEEYLVGDIDDDISLNIVVRRNGVVVDDVSFEFIVNPDTTDVNILATHRE